MSNETKFTPGPWMYRPQEYDDWGVVRAGDSWRGFICQAKDPVVWREDQFAEHRRNGTDPWEANARLIAAAPELYEALDRALYALEALDCSGTEVVKAGRAALSRARTAEVE